MVGGDERAAGASSSGKEAAGDQVVFMWQAGQAEAHYTEAVTGGQVYR